MAPHLFCFGFGYTARVLARRLAAEGWRITGTCRSAEAAAALTAEGIAAVVFDRTQPLTPPVLAGATHILSSVPPDAAGDPVLDCAAREIAGLPDLAWLGYLSTTAVYGDTGGTWVEEGSPLRPTGERGRRRLVAETGWLDLWRDCGVPVHIFRLAAIYGPGRSPFAALRAGTAKRIDKPGQVFSRIHVEDIASVLAASMSRPRPGAVYNLADDEPAPQPDVLAQAAQQLGLPPPPLVPLAAAGLSAMAASFYADNRRVANRLIKSELGVVLRFPDYRAGLAAILAAENASAP